MSARNHWPLRPSTTAHVLDGLAKTLDNIVFEDSEDRHQELVAVMIAMQVFAAELGHFFGGQRGKDEQMLETLERRWMERESGRSSCLDAWRWS